jgi:hypothetical protein
VLRGPGAAERPLFDRLTPAIPAVERARDALREALGLTPPPVPAAAVPADDGDEPLLRQPEPAPPPRPARRGLSALPSSARTFLLVAAGLTVVAAAFVFLSPHLTGETGRLDVRCVHRCRMDGTECLPGGGWSSPMKPGTYVIEVWNPDYPGNWEPIAVDVDDGAVTEFDCRPRPVHGRP